MATLTTGSHPVVSRDMQAFIGHITFNIANAAIASEQIQMTQDVRQVGSGPVDEFSGPTA